LAAGQNKRKTNCLVCSEDSGTHKLGADPQRYAYTRHIMHGKRLSGHGLGRSPL
jgi:hypothetical protein